MYRETTTQFAGFVKNKKTGEYDQLFLTEISELLAKNRTIEHAKEYNEYIEDEYDIADVIIKQRVITLSYGDWEEINNE